MWVLLVGLMSLAVVVWTVVSLGRSGVPPERSAAPVLEGGARMGSSPAEPSPPTLDKRAGAEPKRRPDSVRQFRKHSKVMLMENVESTVNIHERRKCNNK